MATPAVLGALAIVGAVRALWWAFSGEHQTVSAVAGRNLRGSVSRITDLRQAVMEKSAKDRLVRPTLESAAIRMRRFTPAGMVTSLEQRVARAGNPPNLSLERVLGMKLVFGTVGLALGLLRLMTSPSLGALIGAGCFTFVGFFGPDMLLTRKAEERQRQIRVALPDTIDQITISVESGLGFEAALARVTKTSDSPLAQEFGRALQDIRTGLPRGDALRAILSRTDVPELRAFISAILQAEAYGVPIAQVLRVQAREVRIKRKQHAEEQAMKLPVKILFPLVLCIFPTIFIVLLAPAAIRMIDTFSRVNG